MAKRETKKIAAQVAEPPKLVAQSHGGALLSGGMPGHKGGPGRPRDVFREELLKIAQGEGVPVLRAMLRGSGVLRPMCPTHDVPLQCPKKGCGYVPDATSDAVTVITPSADNQLRALDTALKFGLGTKDESVVFRFEGEAELVAWATMVKDTLAEVLPRPLMERVVAALQARTAAFGAVDVRDVPR